MDELSTVLGIPTRTSSWLEKDHLRFDAEVSAALDECLFAGIDLLNNICSNREWSDRKTDAIRLSVVSIMASASQLRQRKRIEATLATSAIPRAIYKWCL